MSASFVGSLIRLLLIIAIIWCLLSASGATYLGI